MTYLLANWKMYPTVDEALGLLGAIQVGLGDLAGAGAAMPRVILCPPSVSLVPLRAAADRGLVHLGAQNCHWENRGPYTGEISPRMLQGLVDYVMVGHRERRAGGETDDHVAAKVRAVAAAGLVPILFVGEDDRAGSAIDQTERRLRHGLRDIDPCRQPVLVVYEPSWAIGARHGAPADHVQRAAEAIKDVLAELGAADPIVIYGGAVAEESIDDLLALDVLDGIGATRASLTAAGFLRLVGRVVGGR